MDLTEGEGPLPAASQPPATASTLWTCTRNLTWLFRWLGHTLNMWYQVELTPSLGDRLWYQEPENPYLMPLTQRDHSGSSHDLFTELGKRGGRYTPLSDRDTTWEDDEYHTPSEDDNSLDDSSLGENYQSLSFDRYQYKAQGLPEVICKNTHQRQNAHTRDGRHDTGPHVTRSHVSNQSSHSKKDRNRSHTDSWEKRNQQSQSSTTATWQDNRNRKGHHHHESTKHDQYVKSHQEHKNKERRERDVHIVSKIPLSVTYGKHRLRAVISPGCTSLASTLTTRSKPLDNKSRYDWQEEWHIEWLIPLIHSTVDRSVSIAVSM